jgi:predicted transcriptional regulator
MHTIADMNANNAAPNSTVTVPVRMPEAMVEALDRIARRHHNSRTGIIRLACDQFVTAADKATGEAAAEELAVPA